VQALAKISAKKLLAAVPRKGSGRDGHPLRTWLPPYTINPEPTDRNETQLLHIYALFSFLLSK
jgi:hypothetical protein